MRRNIVYRHSKPYFDIQIEPNILFGHPQSYFDIRIKAEYSSWTSVSYFAIRTEATYRIGTSISYFDILAVAEYRILTFNILFWRSNWGRISHLDIQIEREYFAIQDPILTFKMRPFIVLRQSKSYFDFKVSWISYLGIQHPILTFE